MTTWRVRMAGGLRSRAGSEAYDWSSEIEAGWKALEIEAARSRRTHRSFAIVAMPAARQLVSTIRSRLRAPDRAWLDGATMYILLTDCNSSQSGFFLRRLRSGLIEGYSLERVSVAVFPEDAVTVGGLLTHLRTGLTLGFDAAPVSGSVATADAPPMAQPSHTFDSLPAGETPSLTAVGRLE